MADIKRLLQTLGLRILRESGTELNCACPGCENGKADGDGHLYVDSQRGLFDCKHGCAKGNPYGLVAFVKFGKTNSRELVKEQRREAMQLLVAHGMAEPLQPGVKGTRPKRTIADEAKKKNITEASLKRLGAEERENGIGFPMRNARGEIVGYRMRLPGEKQRTWAPSGEKKGGHLGLIITEGLDKSKPIILCESETCAAKALDMGLNAMAAPSGNVKPEDADFFRDCVVYVVMDLDKAGVDDADRIARILFRIAKEIRIVRLPGEVKDSKGQDLRDYFNGGKTREDFERLLSEAKPFELVQEASIFDSPYREQNGGIVQITQGQFGETVKPLSRNFTARIVNQIVLDDGVETKRELEIEGTIAEQAKRITIAASQFDGLAWIRDMDANAFLFPGTSVKDSVRAAIQTLSGKIPEKKVFSHTGWREIQGQWVYLHGAGAIGPKGPVPDVEVRLAPDLAAYSLPEPPTGKKLIEAVRASLRILDVAPERITYPLYAAIWRAVLGETDVSLFIAAQKETGKSELAALIQQHFGAGWNGRHFPAYWAGTANAIERLAFFAKDTIFTVDDFAPKGMRRDVEKLHADADRFFRAVGNRSARQRMGGEDKLGITRPPRCFPLSTGEDVPKGQSCQARLIILEVSPDEIDKGKLTALQLAGASGLYAQSLAGFVQWIALNYQAIKDDLASLTRGYRDSLSTSNQLSRNPSNLAHLAAGMKYFTAFARDNGALDEDEAQDLWDRFWNALLVLSKAQSSHQVASDPVQRLFELLTAAIDSGNAHLASPLGYSPTKNPGAYGWRHEHETWQPKGDRIGWIEFKEGQEEGDIYLNPDAALNAAQKMGRESGESLVITLITLSRRIAERGLLKSKDAYDQSHLVRKVIEEKRRRVMHLSETVLWAQAHPMLKKPGHPGHPGHDEILDTPDELGSPDFPAIPAIPATNPATAF